MATYAGVCLWNWRPIFSDESFDTLSNLATLSTFTGSMDESWFYLISVAIEARAGPAIPLMLDAIAAARDNDILTVVRCLRSFAERLDELGTLLVRMYENCDPHVFYHRIRPFLAGSKNMADAGLPRGVIFDTGSGQDQYVEYGGGSNAQSSLQQFCDIVLGVEHRPTGTKAPTHSQEGPTAPPSHHNFIHDMRRYMPGPHRRFLHHVTSVANIRDYVNRNKSNGALCVAYDACLAMLRALREKHIQMVSRYIIVKSREPNRSLPPTPAEKKRPMNLARATTDISKTATRKDLRGTGGTALMPFLKQARDETSEPAIYAQSRRSFLNPYAQNKRQNPAFIGAALGNVGDNAQTKGEVEIIGLTGTWKVDEAEGGLCHS